MRSTGLRAPWDVSKQDPTEVYRASPSDIGLACRLGPVAAPVMSTQILGILWGKGAAPPGPWLGPPVIRALFRWQPQEKVSALSGVVETGYRCAEVYAHAMVASGLSVERSVLLDLFESRDATRDLPTTARAVRTPGEPAKPARGRAAHRARAHR